MNKVEVSKETDKSLFQNQSKKISSGNSGVFSLILNNLTGKKNLNTATNGIVKSENTREDIKAKVVSNESKKVLTTKESKEIINTPKLEKENPKTESLLNNLPKSNVKEKVVDNIDTMKKNDLKSEINNEKNTKKVSVQKNTNNKNLDSSIDSKQKNEEVAKTDKKNEVIKSNNIKEREIKEANQILGNESLLQTLVAIKNTEIPVKTENTTKILDMKDASKNNLELKNNDIKSKVSEIKNTLEKTQTNKEQENSKLNITDKKIETVNKKSETNYTKVPNDIGTTERNLNDKLSALNSNKTENIVQGNKNTKAVTEEKKEIVAEKSDNKVVDDNYKAPKAVSETKKEIVSEKSDNKIVDNSYKALKAEQESKKEIVSEKSDNKIVDNSYKVQKAAPESKKKIVSEKNNNNVLNENYKAPKSTNLLVQNNQNVKIPLEAKKEILQEKSNEKIINKSNEVLKSTNALPKENTILNRVSSANKENTLENTKIADNKLKTVKRDVEISLNKSNTLTTDLVKPDNSLASIQNKNHVQAENRKIERSNESTVIKVEEKKATTQSINKKIESTNLNLYKDSKNIVSSINEKITNVNLNQLNPNTSLEKKEAIKVENTTNKSSELKDIIQNDKSTKNNSKTENITFNNTTNAIKNELKSNQTDATNSNEKLTNTKAILNEMQKNRDISTESRTEIVQSYNKNSITKPIEIIIPVQKKESSVSEKEKNSLKMEFNNNFIINEKNELQKANPVKTDSLEKMQQDANSKIIDTDKNKVVLKENNTEKKLSNNITDAKNIVTTNIFNNPNTIKTESDTKVSLKNISEDNGIKQDNKNIEKSTNDKNITKESKLDSYIKKENLMAENNQVEKASVEKIDNRFQTIRTNLVVEENKSKSTDNVFENTGIKKYGLKTLKTNDDSVDAAVLQNKISEPVKNEEVQPIQQVKSSPINYDSVIEQINNGIKINFNGENNEIRIKLKPEDLGELEIKIRIENGIMKTEFKVENERVKEIIESRFNELKESLQEKGITSSEINVTISNNNGNWSGSSGESEKNYVRKAEKNSTENGKNSDNTIIDQNRNSYISESGVNVMA